MKKAFKKLSEQAEEGAMISLGTSSEKKVLKKGIPNDHSSKHLVGTTTVGLSVGSTLNMDNYESLRVDVWLSDSVLDGETTEQAYDRIAKVVDETLDKLVAQYTE